MTNTLILDLNEKETTSIISCLILLLVTDKESIETKSLETKIKNQLTVNGLRKQYSVDFEI